MYRKRSAQMFRTTVLTASFRSSKQVRVVAPEVIRTELIERFIDVLLEMLDRLQVRVNRGCSVVAAYEFFSHPLNECCHRDLLSL